MDPETAHKYIAEIVRVWGPKEEYLDIPRTKGKTDSGFDTNSAQALRCGRVVSVDQETHRVKVALETGGSIETSCLMSSDSGKSSDVGSLPSEGSFVICGRTIKVGGIEEWTILGTLKSGYNSGQRLIAQRSTPEFPEHNVLERQLSRKIDSSEFQISAEGGGEALFDEGWSLLAADTAEVKYDITTETQVSNLHNTFEQTFSGRTQKGAAVRIIPFDSALKVQSGAYIHPSGLSFQYVTPDGLDPAERYHTGSNPGLVLTEEVHVFHELTDLTPDLTPLLHGEMPQHNRSLMDVSTLPGGDAVWNPQSSDRPPDSQEITIPVLDEPNHPNKGLQKLYTQDAISIQSRRDLRYTHDSNLIGAFEGDTKRYLSPLVPKVFAKHSTELFHDLSPFTDTHPHSNFKLRVPLRAEYSPLVYNQTAYYQTKEGFQHWILGATLDQDNIPLPGDPSQHDKGAGRSAEIFSLGGVEAVLGKTKDEEESLSLTTIGQLFLHLGSDSGKSPHEDRQIKALNHVTGNMEDLDLYNFDPRLVPGGNSNYTSKLGAENLSVVLTTDGGLSARFGRRHEDVGRKFVQNGTSDGPGRTDGGPGAHNAKRAVYTGTSEGDALYRFHDLSTITSINESTCDGDSYDGYDPDIHGRSWDLHLCGDWFMRIGKNADSGISWSMDTDGGLLWYLGKDQNGRSLVIDTDGGAQIHINSGDDSSDALNLRISGNVNEYIDGSVTRHITGDLCEIIEGSRVVTIERDDSVFVKGCYTPAFKDFSLMCSGNGAIGFAGPLGLDVTVSGPTKVDLSNVITKVDGTSTTTVVGLATEIYNNLITKVNGSMTLSVQGAVTVSTGIFSFTGSAPVIFKAPKLTVTSPQSTFSGEVKVGETPILLTKHIHPVSGSVTGIPK